MYKKSVQGWLKHLDFMILDVVCLWISFTLAFNMRHGSLDVLANSLYRDMMWSLALMDIVVIFFFDSLKNVLKRGFYQEFVMTVKQTCLITLCSVFYLFTFYFFITYKLPTQVRSLLFPLKKDLNQNGQSLFN